ncbi:MAG TPA: DUF4397 domain-containing protein [Acidimicrobiales bacterium]|jgi:hypothetical protein
MSLSGLAMRGFRRAAIVVVLTLPVLLVAPALSGPAGAAPAGGFVRLGHFAMGTGAVDEYVDGAVLAKAVAYTGVTPYAGLPSGNHVVALRPAGAAAGATPLVTLTVPVGAGTYSTVAIVPAAGGVTASVYADDLSAPPAGQAKVRVIHAVPSIQAVNVYVSPAPAPTAGSPTAIVASPTAVSLPSTPAFANVAFGTASSYAALPAGSYEVDLQAAGTGQVVLAAHSWPVSADTVASVVVLQGGQGLTLEVLRDAAGTTAVPTGAMATGEGGTAHPSTGGLPGGLPIAAATLVALGAVVAGSSLRRRHRRPFRASAAQSADGC